MLYCDIGYSISIFIRYVWKVDTHTMNMSRFPDPQCHKHICNSFLTSAHSGWSIFDRFALTVAFATRTELYLRPGTSGWSTISPQLFHVVSCGSCSELRFAVLIFGVISSCTCTIIYIKRLGLQGQLACPRSQNCFHHSIHLGPCFQPSDPYHLVLVYNKAGLVNYCLVEVQIYQVHVWVWNSTPGFKSWWTPVLAPNLSRWKIIFSPKLP
jgi:hypothetical protein